MIFQNPQVDLQSLPDINEVVFLKPAPAYLKVVLLSTAFFMTFLLVGVVVAMYMGAAIPIPYFRAILFGIWLTLAIFSFWLSQKGYHNQAYALRQKDILYKRGVITQTLTTIPFNRVQHCEIKQGPIERYFGLKTLQVFTAGGQASDLSIPGLRGETAQDLKEYIIKTTKLDGSSEEE